MTPSPFLVVLDACVLVDACLRDTLLRLAETPRQYSPRWTEPILDEVRSTLINKLNRTEAEWSRLRTVLERNFPEAWIEDSHLLVPSMTNQAKDRHVAAAAVKAGASIIVTYNLRDFKAEDLKPWNIEAISPDEFLTDCLDLNPQVVVRKLEEQASDANKTVSDLLNRMGRVNLHRFVNQVTAELSQTALPRSSDGCPC